MLVDERFQLSDDVRVTIGLQIRLDAPLERSQPQLVEPGDLVLSESFEAELGERGAAPEAERLSQKGGALRRLRVARSVHEAIETPEVELLGLDAQDISRRLPQEDVGPEQLPQL